MKIELVEFLTDENFHVYGSKFHKQNVAKSSDI